MFSFSFRKFNDKKRKQIVYPDHQKCKFFLLAPSLRQQLILVLCFYRVIETQFYTNQHPHFLWAIFQKLLATT